MRNQPALRTLYDAAGRRQDPEHHHQRPVPTGLIGGIFWIVSALNEKGQLAPAKWQRFPNGDMCTWGTP